ncbi:MAG: hypothetical protein ACYYKD_02620 [Rhodospirillales bacterium]
MTESVAGRILEKRGIKNSETYLESLEDGAKVGYADRPGIDLRGSVHLMLRRVITRKEVTERFDKLKHL